MRSELTVAQLAAEADLVLEKLALVIQEMSSLLRRDADDE